MPEIIYRLTMPEPHTQTFGVEMRLDGATGPVDLVMPTWTPGSYMVREFARHVLSLRAEDGAGTPLRWTKTDKLTWRVEAPADGALRVSYRVYAHELSVRSSHLDASHGYVNGASTFLYAAGRERDPVRLEVEAPEGWTITTGLPKTETAGVFRAADYDELVDCPLEMGTHELVEWEQGGKTHRYAVWGRGNQQMGRLVEDTRKVVDATRELFGGELPYDEYTFFLHIVPGEYGGLEHRNSTSIVLDRWGFRGMEYERAIVLAAHEFFHVWNGKRIRPAELGPFDYTRENYTRSLWVVEGFTTYYTDVLLRRAGVMPPQRFLERTGGAIAHLQTLPGRLEQTLEDASFDAWIKYYRQDENTPNATISYYHKGAMVSMLLDLKIRETTRNRRSLDDVLRILWERYGLLDVGFPEGGVQDVVAEVCGDRMDDFFDLALRSTEELDFDGPLAAAGLELVAPPAMPGPGGPGPMPMPGGPMAGPGGPGGPPLPPLTTGIRTKEEAGKSLVGTVVVGGPGHRAGINAGDELVALDGLRVNARDIQARIMEREPGDVVQVTVFRRDELLTLPLTLERAPAIRPVLRRVQEPTALQTEIFRSWLGIREGEGAAAPGGPAGG
ncbi:MAG TPA: PDZ domain-containing protein [Longimicrobiaceae bacterium]|jgi:predicted metalloprotease with PDZ domain